MNPWIPIKVFFLSIIIGLLFFQKTTVHNHLESAFTNEAPFGIWASTGTTFFEQPPQETWAWIGWDSWELGADKKGKAIIRVDSDGDIFFRGKWIGWDGNLTREVKEYREQLSHETN